MNINIILYTEDKIEIFCCVWRLNMAQKAFSLQPMKRQLIDVATDNQQASDMSVLLPNAWTPRISRPRRPNPIKFTPGEAEMKFSSSIVRRKEIKIKGKLLVRVPKFCAEEEDPDRISMREILSSLNSSCSNYDVCHSSSYRPPILQLPDKSPSPASRRKTAIEKVSIQNPLNYRNQSTTQVVKPVNFSNCTEYKIYKKTYSDNLRNIFYC